MEEELSSDAYLRRSFQIFENVIDFIRFQMTWLKVVSESAAASQNICHLQNLEFYHSRSVT